jgi:hypothetical protein
MGECRIEGTGDLGYAQRVVDQMRRAGIYGDVN